MSDDHIRKRLLLLMPTTTYRTEPFLEAAQQLDIEVVVGTDFCHVLADEWNVPLALRFRDPSQAVVDIIDYDRAHPLDAIVPVDDKTTEIAARACEALALAHNAPAAAVASRNKYLLRTLLDRAEVASPGYSRYELTDDPVQIASEQTYPCVLKPLLLSGSRGVIRVDTPETFVEAFYRIGRILQHSPDLAPSDDPDAQRLLVESYIPGVEVALEGLLMHGDLRVLAIFDKPDPLEGPYFEETIYVTPSRLPEGIQQAIIDKAEQATRAIGLSEGPVHAELRINNDGPWVIEVAGRSIGGLCSRTLQFGLGISLEELILRQALRLDIDTLEQCGQASGVMMLPIPEGGIFERVEGVEAACQVEGIENMVITAKKGEILKPLPEGGGYPGFLFARGTTPAFVEQALRNAYDCLRLRIKEELPLIKS